MRTILSLALLAVSASAGPAPTPAAWRPSSIRLGAAVKAQLGALTPHLPEDYGDPLRPGLGKAIAAPVKAAQESPNAALASLALMTVLAAPEKSAALNTYLGSDGPAPAELNDELESWSSALHYDERAKRLVDRTLRAARRRLEKVEGGADLLVRLDSIFDGSQFRAESKAKQEAPPALVAEGRLMARPTSPAGGTERSMVFGTIDGEPVEGDEVWDVMVTAKVREEAWAPAARPYESRVTKGPLGPGPTFGARVILRPAGGGRTIVAGTALQDFHYGNDGVTFDGVFEFNRLRRFKLKPEAFRAQRIDAMMTSGLLQDPTYWSQPAEEPAE